MSTVRQELKDLITWARETAPADPPAPPQPPKPRTWTRVAAPLDEAADQLVWARDALSPHLATTETEAGGFDVWARVTSSLKKQPVYPLRVSFDLAEDVSDRAGALVLRAQRIAPPEVPATPTTTRCRSVFAPDELDDSPADEPATRASSGAPDAAKLQAEGVREAVECAARFVKLAARNVERARVPLAPHKQDATAKLFDHELDLLGEMLLSLAERLLEDLGRVTATADTAPAAMPEAER